MMRTTLFALAFTFPLAASAGPREDADAHVARATAANQEGKLELALVELEFAYALDPRPELLFATAQVHAKLGACEVAVTFYERFLATAPPPEAAAQTQEAIGACKLTLTLAAATAEPASPAPPLAAAPPPPTTESEPLGLIIGARVGGIVPLDGLSPFVHGGIELGYALPVLGRQLAIVVAVDYTQPTANGQEADPRVMGGAYTWKLTEQELGVMATLMYRATSIKPVIPYGGIGPRVLFARSKVRDDGTPMTSTTTEQSTRLGIGIPLGVELPLGPGNLLGEILLQYGTLDHVATGDAHTGAITFAVGYRMVL